MLEPNVGTKCWNQWNQNILILSSLFFITNAISTLYKKYYVYSFLFVCLTLSSLMFHTNTTIYTNIIDKCCITAVVVYGGYMLYNKHTQITPFNMFLIVVTFLSCLFFFFYGYYVNDYCYHPDKYIGDMFHSMIHLISSFGHHLIIFL